MGATYEEVVADYMVTYYNYYGVEPGTEKYTAISESNIIKSLQTAFGVADLSTADLKSGAVGYMKAIGLTDAEIAALTANLSGIAADPQPEEPTDSIYVVVSGDCLWNLAKKFYGSGTYWKVIFDANDAVTDASMIFVGQQLVIPNK